MASMHMFIMFGLVWLSVEQETCPPHVGQFVTLNNRPYQKEPIVVKVKKKKGTPPPSLKCNIFPAMISTFINSIILVKMIL